jgi:hypothetical protein
MNIKELTHHYYSNQMFRKVGISLHAYLVLCGCYPSCKHV